MIQSYLRNLVLLPNNESALSYERDCIRTRGANCCGWLQHSEGSPLYKILTGGRYKISFNANVSAATAGQVAFQLFMDGQPIPGSLVIAYIGTAGTYQNIAFNKVINVCCRGNATLTIQEVPSVLAGTSVAASVPTATQPALVQTSNLIIEKIA